MTSGAWANCPASPEIALVSVGALHDSPSVRYSYPVGQIADLASVVGHKGAHPPYGFYASTLTYSVNVQAAPNSTVADPACVPALSIQLDLQLVDRIVEIGTGGTCNHDVVATHYLAHADQDDRLLRRYAELARARLGTMVGSRLERFEQNGNWEAAMKRLAQGIIEELLRNYDMDRQGALASADTNDELARLREACTSRTL